MAPVAVIVEQRTCSLVRQLARADRSEPRLPLGNERQNERFQSLARKHDAESLRVVSGAALNSRTDAVPRRGSSLGRSGDLVLQASDRVLSDACACTR